MLVLFRGHDEVICSGSPFIAAAILTACAEDVPTPDDYGRALCWNLIWFAVYVVAALFLLRWTVRNFNRYCGRMEDRFPMRRSFRVKGSWIVLGANKPQHSRVVPQRTDQWEQERRG
jgi:hypothetical protein